ncbi:MAG: N-acetylneuraminate synthase family protein, partial [Lachnospiraceae bacterium]|nr:N-acetylneuraminate synthase family protein [Lachnospiraceae bacterium]
LGVIRKFHTTNLTLLQCNTEYPTPYSDVNLRAMKTMQEEFRVPVGYSDHTQGIAMSLAAVALGAQVIEKHFTLDRQMEGPDHKASLIPEELEELVMGIRQIELGLGSGIKIPSESEKKNITAARKSIVAGKDIHKGELFSVDNLAVKRPGSGLSPMKWNQVLGQRANRDYKADELLDDIIE